MCGRIRRMTDFLPDPEIFYDSFSRNLLKYPIFAI